MTTTHVQWTNSIKYIATLHIRTQKRHEMRKNRLIWQKRQKKQNCRDTGQTKSLGGKKTQTKYKKGKRWHSVAKRTSNHKSKRHKMTNDTQKETDAKWPSKSQRMDTIIKAIHKNQKQNRHSVNSNWSKAMQRGRKGTRKLRNNLRHKMMIKMQTEEKIMFRDSWINVTNLSVIYFTSAVNRMEGNFSCSENP